MRHTGRGLLTWEEGWGGITASGGGPAWVTDGHDYPESLGSGERGEPGLWEGLLTLGSQRAPPGPTPVRGKR